MAKLFDDGNQAILWGEVGDGFGVVGPLLGNPRHEFSSEDDFSPDLDSAAPCDAEGLLSFWNPSPLGRQAPHLEAQ